MFIDELSKIEKERLSEALKQLATNNPNIINQLEALAKIKNEKPIKWNIGLKALGLK